MGSVTAGNQTKIPAILGLAFCWEVDGHTPSCGYRSGGESNAETHSGKRVQTRECVCGRERWLFHVVVRESLLEEVTSKHTGRR